MSIQKFAFVLLSFLFAAMFANQSSADQPETAKRSLIADDYTTAKYPLRDAARGDWKIADGQASVTQDDELYKKYKNHGPIMNYKVDHADASAVVEFKPNDCKSVVFTMDAKEGGHAFRVRLKPQGKGKGGPSSDIVTYADKKPGADHADIIVLNKEVPTFKNNEWNRIEISVRGEDATVTFGDKTFEVSHPQIAQQKSIAKLGFSFGALAIRKFEVVAN